MQRKPGGYRKPTEVQRDQSRMSKEEYQEWVQQFWHLTVLHAQFVRELVEQAAKADAASAK